MSNARKPFSLEIDTTTLCTVYENGTDLAIGIIIYHGGDVRPYQAFVGTPDARRLIGWHDSALTAMDEIVSIWTHES